MALMSKLASATRPLLLRNTTLLIKTPVRMSGGVRYPYMHIKASRWDWMVFKNYLNFYLLLLGLPLAMISFYANVFVGLAELTPLPADRAPEHWEYERHPVTRWMAKHIYMTEQEGYERTVFAVWERRKCYLRRALKREVKRQMALDDDYKGYYYRPFSARFLRSLHNYKEQGQYRASGMQSASLLQRPESD